MARVVSIWGKQETATECTAPDKCRASHPSVAPLAGDLARRVVHRRTELGMSTEELAHRAGVDAWFLAYFEQSTDSTLSGSALLRLAAALETTPFALNGGQVDRTPGSGRAGRRPALEFLTVDECETHLRAGGVGRIVFMRGMGPEALPVNFTYSDGAIVFRTEAATARAIAGMVGFEVDHIDEAMSEGWSVLVKGHAHLVEDPDEARELASLGLDPWAGGPRHSLVVVTPRQVTGRAIVQPQVLENESESQQH